jgi:hypothetical protein
MEYVRGGTNNQSALLIAHDYYQGIVRRQVSLYRTRLAQDCEV